MSTNNKTDQSKDKTSRRKWPWVIPLCVLVVIGGARLALMTGGAGNWARNMIVDAANQQLVPRLSIETLSGDLWHGVTLTGIALTDENNTVVASIDTLQIEYRPLSYFSDALVIEKMRLSRPFIKLSQQPDSSWNAGHWLDGDTSAGDTTAADFHFLLSDLSMEQGQVDVSMPSLGADSSFVVDNMNFSCRIGFLSSGYDATVDDFSFKIMNTRLDTPVSFTTSGNADETSVTLEKLAVATGYSMVTAAGRANLSDSTAELQAEASPLGWHDLAVYMEDENMPVREDVDISLGFEATATDVRVRLNARADGIEQFRMNSHFHRDSTLELSSFDVSADRLDLAVFTGDTTMPALQNMMVRGTGTVPLGGYRNARLEGTLSADNLRQGPYRLDALRGEFTLGDAQAHLHLEPAVGREKLMADVEMSNIWSEKPSVGVAVRGTSINPASWLRDEAYTGNLTFNGRMSGNGWYPGSGQAFWNYRLTVRNSRLMDQQVDRATFAGRLNQDAITNESRLAINKSQLHLQADIRQFRTRPAFSYSLTASDLNVADVAGMEEYPSSVSATVEGKGKGGRLQNLELQSRVRVDSSIFLGEAIRSLDVDLQVSDTVMTVQNGMLESDIADGHFSGRFHLDDPYDVSNSLNMGIELKDLSSFASVAGVDVLRAAGSINGKLTPNGQDLIVFEGKADLEEVNYDNRFTAPRVSGALRLGLTEEPEYVADFEIVRPVIASVDLQNIRLKTEGQRSGNTANGTYELELAGQHQNRIDQAGAYRVSEDSLMVEMSTFDLTSSLRTLSLQKPFHITWSNSTLQTDTLHIRSSDGSSYMELAVPHADSLHQKGYFRAQKLNLKAIQDAILGNSYLDGVLMGEFRADRTDTSLVASGHLSMSNVHYEETVLDTFKLQTDIDNKRLEGMMELHQGGELIAEGDLDIPFRAENPELLEERFFEQPVSGKLVLHAITLGRFETLLKQAGYENTKGILQFEGTLEGEAGEPKMDATFHLSEAMLSGVPIDSLVASLEYQHTQSNLNLNATLTSLNQKALQVDARMPLDVNLRSWEVGLPGPGDSLSVAVLTNQFNLKALNDFLGRDMVRNLQGRINGMVNIEGPRNSLQTSGEFSLQNGGVRVVPANIRLDNIGSTIRFKPDEIELTKLSMRSGSGTLNARGTVSLNELVPGAVKMNISAKNFKVANTDEYNGIINLNVDVGGSLSQPRLSGTLDVINGFVELDNFGEKSVEEVSLDTAMAPEPEISLYDSLSLDMDVGFNRRFFVRNQRYLEMELELEGQIDLLKDPGDDLQMFGNLTTADGYAEPLGKRFELEEGALAFSGPVDNPEVNIRTLYEPPQTDQEIKIWYIIEGTVEAPQFKYESSPPMDLAGIISYTLFGQPFYKLNPAEQSVARTSSSNTAADFALDVLMDRVESLATRHLGIDVVRIENTRVGGESGTSISTGWYINPRVFFAIQNVITGSTPTTGFYLEYYLKENLRLILSQGVDNRQGIDMQWEYDY
ncbi:Family of unknown function [Fodinibius roseus]|uniref:Translocation and assembly module TamB C-terminal domain-containing protein n=1 Tax=Fodinibius roseus TaxID=1194090 RepID=A0A1M4V165_9BACT|nr:translocation/assembly module TamB domain-containing protein [Fodinibius roseus]SHE62650.1 Family of unknown function [Fodinibius roseus]